ncbi:MAG: hypothetical protein ACRD1E_03170, partial [Terriglobales bacterium]
MSPQKKSGPYLLALAAVLAAGMGLAAQQAPDMSKRPELGPVKAYAPPTSQADQLPNGLKIVVIEDHRFPLVTVRLALRAGVSRLKPE